MTDPDRVPAPIFDRLADEHGPAPRHALRRPPMGEPATTALPDPDGDLRTFTSGDGSAYTRMPASRFFDGDRVDSAAVVDWGAPP